MTAKLRLTDLYATIQGEGPRVGEPTVFIRFGGCNMRCPGWPCDTQHAIEPSLWKNDPLLTHIDILDRLNGVPKTRNYCITGGEPFMQPADELSCLANALLHSGATIDVFTNGSLKPFPSWTEDENVSLILDWKLKGSGEADTAVEMRLENLHRLKAKDAVKFVIASDEDYKEALEVYTWRQMECKAPFYVGAAWGKIAEQDIVVALLRDGLPWRLNVQIHKHIFDPEDRQI
jgi:7-carboxy-7-deazaguanine synthase